MRRTVFRRRLQLWALKTRIPPPACLELTMFRGLRSMEQPLLQRTPVTNRNRGIRRSQVTRRNRAIHRNRGRSIRFLSPLMPAGRHPALRTRQHTTHRATMGDMSPRLSTRRTPFHSPQLQHRTTSSQASQAGVISKRKASLTKQLSRIRAWRQPTCRGRLRDTATRLPPLIPGRLTLERALPMVETLAATALPLHPMGLRAATPIALLLPSPITPGQPTAPRRPTVREPALRRRSITRLRPHLPRTLPEAVVGTPLAVETGVFRKPRAATAEVIAGRV